MSSIRKDMFERIIDLISVTKDSEESFRLNGKGLSPSLKERNGRNASLTPTRYTLTRKIVKLQSREASCNREGFWISCLLGEVFQILERHP